MRCQIRCSAARLARLRKAAGFTQEPLAAEQNRRGS